MQEDFDVEGDAAAGTLEPESNGIRRCVWSCDETYLLDDVSQRREIYGQCGRKKCNAANMR
jgi:hypothetical protein